MKQAKKTRLKRAGWTVGTADEFLGLSREQSQVVELKLALGDFLRRNRSKRRLTQAALAERIGSSQSRIAKLETGVRGVSLDLLFRALFATGVKADEIAKEILHSRRTAA